MEWWRKLKTGPCEVKVVMRWDLYTCMIVEFFQSPISTNASHCVSHSIWWLFMLNCAAVLCSPHWLDMLKGFHSFEWWFVPVLSVCCIFKRPAGSIYLKSWTCYQHGFTNSWDITTFKVICISYNNCSSTSFATNFVSVAVSTHRRCAVEYHEVLISKYAMTSFSL
jgi:hypothetical protein